MALLMVACVPAVPEATPRTLPSLPVVTTQVDADAGPIGAPARREAASRPVYFVMVDRFFNGDTSNDAGATGSADPLISGFLPTDKGFYQGGDLAGLSSQLDYLAGMGVEAIWVTPPLGNRAVQGNGTIEGSSAAYHGYWITDFAGIDPHLGSDAEMSALIEEAHGRGIAVYFDIVVNHTADVIGFEEQTYAYMSQAASPYLDEAGAELDLTAQPLPEITGFPYTPVFASLEDATAKNPAWLNDPARYHNRGNAGSNEESGLLGDFFGLDDLFTEQQSVRSGMVDIYTDLMDRFEIDGFRVDTARHVEDGFWEHFLPAVLDHATEIGRDDFFIYAEVFDSSPITVSRYVTEVGFPSALDFPLNAAVETFVTLGRAAALDDVFDRDDWYTDIDSSAYDLVTFAGNHDMGRIGRLLPGSADEKLQRMRMVFELLFLTRGAPIVYYGDEQGFTGDGGDKDARQTMFASTVASYLDDDLIGTTADHSTDRFDREHPLYRLIGELTALRQAHPSLVAGAQVTRLAEGGTFAISRIDRDERVEHVVVFNGPDSVEAEIPTSSPDTLFGSVYGKAIGLDSDGTGVIRLSLEPWSTVVLVADVALPQPSDPLTVSGEFTENRDNVKLSATLGDARYAEVTFSVSVGGSSPTIVGVDDAAPFRVYWRPPPDPVPSELIATAIDGFGNVAVFRTPLLLDGS